MIYSIVSSQRYISITFVYKELGLTPDSISSWEIPSEVLRNFKDRKNKPKNLPISYFMDEYQNCIRIYLKGAAQNGAIDAMSFQTQMPKSYIAKHIERLESKGRIIFCGPRFVHSRIEMGFVAKRLAEYMLVKNQLKINSLHIAIYNAIDPDETFGFPAFMEDIKERCKNAQAAVAVGSAGNNFETLSGSVPPPHVVVIENMQAWSQNLSMIVKEFNDFRDSCKQVPYTIGTFVRPMRPR